ncbi:hypothetical protein BBK14_02040 [Parafrankia soli]|uniref:Uncharacterized protein n=1 Tax=Parafrankia soli TaxID=2599596 RepID=A0A1S1RLG5_9ACTN|nr:hypothetical protein [Parafrankia soli]OHV46651.1 hypothetical protein BBK14_02040 [Parafrankia soli]
MTSSPTADDQVQAQRPGMNVHTSEDGTSTADIELGITAADLSSGLALLVPAESRLVRIDGTKRKPTFVFRSQR